MPFTFLLYQTRVQALISVATDGMRDKDSE